MDGKLIRDRIPDIERANGGVPLTRTASPEEFRELLRDKLREEALEAAEARGPALTGELADVLDIVHEIAAEAGIRPEVLDRLRAAKHAERGGFADRVVWMGNEGQPAPAMLWRERTGPGLDTMLRQAHAHFGASSPAEPVAELPPGVDELRSQMLQAEVDEFNEAIAEGDLPHIAKEGGDVLYVTAGTLRAHGIDPDAAVAAVHGSNMTKEPGGDGKAIKGPGYAEPDMEAVVWPGGRPVVSDLEAGRPQPGGAMETGQTAGAGDLGQQDQAGNLSERWEEGEDAREAAWWREREDAYRRRLEIQEEIARRQAGIDERNATAQRVEEQLECQLAAGVPGAQEAINRHYTLDAVETCPPMPSAKDDPAEWRAYFLEFAERDLPLHAHDAAERHRVNADAPADVGGMAAAYYEGYEPSVTPEELTAEARGITLDALLTERRQDEIGFEAT